MKIKEEKKQKEIVDNLEGMLFNKKSLICADCDLVSVILNTIEVLVVILNYKGQIIFFNRACEKVTGYKAGEVSGKYIWEILIAPEEIESVKNIFDKLEKSHVAAKHENSWVTKRGTKHLISWSNSVLAKGRKSSEYIIGTGVDITAHKKAEERIESHSEELERLNKLMVGRELKMIELKKEIENLKSKLAG